MVDAFSWVAVAIAWLAALLGDQHKTLGVAECNCNCTCEVNPLPCAGSPWWWELLKAVALLLFGVLVGGGYLVVGVAKLAGGWLWLTSRATSSVGDESLPRETLRGPPSTPAIGDQQRDRALQQLELVRARRVQRA